MKDNCVACRERLFQIWEKEYKAVCKKDSNDDTRAAARFILERNIVCGNALNLCYVDEDSTDTKDLIVFSEWTFPFNDARMQRKDYIFKALVNADEPPKKKNQKEQVSLFEEEEEQPDEEGIFLRQYITHYRRLGKDE